MDYWPKLLGNFPWEKKSFWRMVLHCLALCWYLVTIISIAESFPGHQTQWIIPECAPCGVAKRMVLPSGIITKFPQNRHPLWANNLCSSCVKGLIFSDISTLGFAVTSRSTFITTKYNCREEPQKHSITFLNIYIEILGRVEQHDFSKQLFNFPWNTDRLHYYWHGKRECLPVIGTSKSMEKIMITLTGTKTCYSTFISGQECSSSSQYLHLMRHSTHCFVV